VAKHPENGRGQGHVTRFKDFSQNHIFLIGEAMHFKFRVSFDTEDTSVCMVA